MGMNKTEIIAVTFAVLVVFCGLGAGIGGLIVEEANGNYVQGLAELHSVPQTVSTSISSL